MSFADIQLPSNRKFGLFFTAVFLIASFYFHYSNSPVLDYLFGTLAIIFLAISIINADVLLPLNRLWMGFGLLLGKIVNPLILGVIFFGIFSPIAIFMRIFGRDELRLRFKKQNKHWVKRRLEEQSNSFENQF